MHRQQRVKVSGMYLPVNKNLKLKMISYITLKYISYKSVLKKTFQVQTYYLWYSIYKYSSIIQFIARTLFGCYKISKGVYIKKWEGGWKAARRIRIIFMFSKVPG